MKKEWILNIACNRWGLNKKNKVGPVSMWIRECSPRDMDEWKNYYFEKLRGFLIEQNINLEPEEYLKSLGETLYIKITEVMRKEIDDVKLEDCIRYIYELVIDRTFQGYQTEKKTVYEQLEKILGERIEPAPDEIDRRYNVDFIIKVAKNKLIGQQIKPITFKTSQEYERLLRDIHEQSHKKFTEKFGGKVFIILSTKEGQEKTIHNKEVIDEIKEEITKLKSEK